MLAAIRQMIQRINMREKIFLVFAVGTLGAMLLQAMLFSMSSSEVIYEQEREMSQSTLQNLQDDLYQEIKEIENSMIRIYDDRELIRALGRMEDGGTVETQSSSTAYKLALGSFETSQNLVALYIYTPSHRLVSSYRHAQTPKYTYPQDIYDGKMENNVDLVLSYVESDSKTMLITGYHNIFRQKTLLRFVIKLYRDAGDPIGYLVCDMDSKNVQQLMEKYRYDDESIIWLQQTGTPALLQIGTPDEAQSEWLGKVQSSVAVGNADAFSDVDDYEVIAVPQQKYGLTAYSLVSQTALFANQHALNQTTMMVFLLVLILFSMLFVMLSNNLTGPLRHMMSVMRRVRNGETELRMETKRLDEIGELGRTFDDMLDQIQILTARKYQDKLRLNDAKYKALQAQVNPHFLYNTLDTMSGIAVSQDCFRVSALCRALSDIFRYSLDMEEPFSTLEEELFHLKNYMFVMNERMQNMITLHMEIDTALMKAKLPRLSLQPLVENAIQHGLKNKRGEKSIFLGSSVSDNTLCITVADNGIGMDADEINRRLSLSTEEALNRSSSIGMDNINARIHILFGDQYGLKAVSPPEGGSRVHVYLPYLLEESPKTNAVDKKTQSEDLDI